MTTANNEAMTAVARQGSQVKPLEQRWSGQTLSSRDRPPSRAVGQRHF